MLGVERGLSIAPRLVHDEGESTSSALVINGNIQLIIHYSHK